jgi:uncharacterized protein (DUF885 family)
VGHPGRNDRRTDNSLEAIARRKREIQTPLKFIETIQREKLNAADQLDYDLFRNGIEDEIEGNHFHEDYLAISQLGGGAKIAKQAST